MFIMSGDSTPEWLRYRFSGSRGWSILKASPALARVRTLDFSSCLGYNRLKGIHAARRQGMDNKELIIRAVTDPAFRSKLESSPKDALGLARLTDRNLKEVRTILDTVKKIDGMVASVIDSLLCST
jgi:hypothetical protein